MVQLAGDVPGAPKPFAVSLAGGMNVAWGKEYASGDLTVKFDDSTVKTKVQFKGL